MSGTPTRRQLSIIAAAVVATASLRFVFGPFSLQGVLFVAITAVAAWQIGMRAGLVSMLMGLAASHALRVVSDPSLLRHPSALLTRQYLVGVGTYLVLCGLALTVGRRHRLTVTQLASTTAEKARADEEHRAALQLALERERTARRQSEASTLEREQLLVRLSEELDRASRLAAIVEHSDDAIVATDLDNTVQSWNRAAETLFGFSTDEMVGASLDAIVPDERRDEDRHVRALVTSGETVRHFETARRRRDGSLVDVSLTVSPIRNSAGDVIGASRIARDITERRASERSIAELHTRLVALTAASSTLLRSPRREDVTHAILAVARDLLPADGYAVWQRQEPGRWDAALLAGVAEAFTDAIPAEVGDASLVEPLAVEDVTAEPLLVRRRDQHAKAGVRSILVVPLLRGEQAAATVVFYHQRRHVFLPSELEAARAFSNIASAAMTTAELYEAQQRSRLQSEFLADVGVLLANSLDHAVTLQRVAALTVPSFADLCAVDVVEASGGVRRLVARHDDPGVTRLAEDFHRRYPEDPTSPYSVAHAIRTGQAVLVGEIRPSMLGENATPRMRAAVGELGIRSFMIAPMLGRDGGVGALTFALTDGSRRYDAEDLRFASAIASRAAMAVENARAYEEATRANRLKDEFIATLSHELRTPLNAVLGYARMLNSGTVDEDRRARALGIVERNALALVRIVEDVLDVSRLASGSMQLLLAEVDLIGLVNQAIASVRPGAEAKGLALTPRVEGPPVFVRADGARLQQVVWNLLGNAIKFTPAGGRIDVSLEASASDVSLVVADTGSGIAPEFLPHVFERFRQGDSTLAREHGGLGLGLAIAHDIVRLHGGHIVASSEGRGRGATFQVQLPLVGRPGPTPLASEASIQPE